MSIRLRTQGDVTFDTLKPGDVFQSVPRGRLLMRIDFDDNRAVDLADGVLEDYEDNDLVLRVAEGVLCVID